MTSKKTPEYAFDAERAKTKLRFRFGNAHIVSNPEMNPTEVVCEVEPTVDHPDHSVAVAVLGRSMPHHHERTTETYKVLSGVVELHLGERAVKLAAPQEKVVPPGTVHWARSIGESDAWVRVTSEPGWTPEDHIKDRVDD